MRQAWVGWIGGMMLAGAVLGAEGADTVVGALLVETPPAPDWKPFVDRYDKESPPPDDAPIDLLVAYWSTWWDWMGLDHSAPVPTDRVRQRLAEAAFESYWRLEELLPVLPESAEVTARLKEIYARLPEGDHWDGRLRWMIGRQLLLRDGAHRDQLVKAIEEAAWEDPHGVNVDEETMALARLDWNALQALLKKHADAAKDPHVATWALAMLLSHDPSGADAPALRTRLRAIVEDRRALPGCRAEAILALMKTTWEGQETWFLGLFADETFGTSNADGEAPLRRAVASDPDRWVPALAKMVGKKPLAHRNAVECLAWFSGEPEQGQGGPTRSDALRALVGCLAEPGWAAQHTEVVTALGRVDVPESVPALLSLMRHGDNACVVACAAEALCRYRPAEAAMTVREAIRRIAPTDTEYERLVAAAYRLGGFTEDEIVEAVLAEAMSRAALLSREESIAAAQGVVLVDEARENDGVGKQLLERARVLRDANPATAKALETILQDWSSPSIDAEFIERLRERITGNAIQAALERRKGLRRNVPGELRKMLEAGGPFGGMAAVVLEDAQAARAILAGKDQQAQEMMLACARLVRAPLPLSEVARLMDRGRPLTVRAAEAYLVSEDSAEARRLVRARHPGELLIVGSGEMMTADVELARRIRADDGPTEVFELTRGGGYAPRPVRWKIEVRRAEARLIVEQWNGVRRTRRLTDQELNDLRRSLQEWKVDDLPRIDSKGWDIWQFRFTHLTRDGGRFLAMDQPFAWTPHGLLVRRFEELGRTGAFEMHHAIAGVGVVLCDERYPASAVWKRGTDVRVVVGHLSSGEWMTVKEGRAGAPVAQPEECGVTGDSDDVPEGWRGLLRAANPCRWQVSAGDGWIRAGDHAHAGLWLCRRGRAPERLCEGEYSNPIVSGDGDWCIANRQTVKSSLVRVDLATREATEVELEKGADAQAIAYLPAHQAVLIWVHKMDGSSHYALLEPATGQIQRVGGEFEPIRQQSYRTLQPTGRPDEAWAAIMDREHRTTRIGRYDVRKFEFTPVRTLPGVLFESMEMWVDEKEGAAYVVADGDLLRVPLGGANP